MKQFIFPAVVYYQPNEEVYTLYIKDVGIIVQGDTVEEAFSEALFSLESYCKVSLKLSGRIEEASNFDDLKVKYSRDIVLLVSAKI